MDAQELIHKKLVLCVREHQRAIQYTQILQSAFSVALFVQVMLNILTLSVTGVQTLLKLADGSISDVLRLLVWMLGQYFHLVFIHFPGQKLANFSEQVYYDSLECMWYIFFHKSRSVYQFLIMNTLFPCRLYALKVTTLNMETLLKFTKAAVSYFTVLSSTL
ncbi:uncharacterized protein LOC143373952 [Andrena cerasifolii]|uniref:uncharacterized protein LOC143373952 n=1 Tax=Andrena cerasifolii TaxID=2819439 RepID=UPI0040377D14